MKREKCPKSIMQNVGSRTLNTLISTCITYMYDERVCDAHNARDAVNIELCRYSESENQIQQNHVKLCMCHCHV